VFKLLRLKLLHSKVWGAEAEHYLYKFPVSIQHLLHIANIPLICKGMRFGMKNFDNKVNMLTETNAHGNYYGMGWR
jgi:hypothetical protein